MKKLIKITLIFCLLFTQWLQAQINYNNKRPVMGWSSWNNFRININQTLIKQQADAMILTGLREAGYNFINIDDGFFGGRDEHGNILTHKERFPSGMKSLADYIHKKGLKAGIYAEAGINTCASIWDKDTVGYGSGLYGHDEKDLTLMLKTWGFDFIKIDWCGAEIMGLSEEARYTQLAKIIRKVKPETIFNICRWKFPGIWAPNIAESWRISGDISNNFSSILKIIDLNADLWIYSSAGHVNDMDMLQVGRGMSYEEDKSHFAMWCIMNSPLLLGNDLRSISEETLKIVTNKNIIALNQDELGYQARRLQKVGEIEIWGKPLVATTSGKVALAILNRANSNSKITIDLSKFGINVNKPYTLTNLWTSEKIAHNNELKIELKPHETVVLHLAGSSLLPNIFQSAK